MKKQYITPTLVALAISTEQIVCTSKLQGITGTASFSTSISEGETDEYLSRSRESGNEWADNGLW